MSRLYKVIYTTLTILTVSGVFLIFIIDPGINGYYPAMFKDMVYGQAFKPFVYRVLLPTLVRLVTAVLPPNIHAFINQSNLHFGNWEQEFLTEYLVASILMCASLIGFGFAMKYLFNGLLQAPGWFVDAVSLTAIAGLPLFFNYYSYIYDFPTLFLFTLGLGLMARCKWQEFLVLFPVACLNKETSILLTFIFVLYFFKRKNLMNHARFAQLLLYQLSLFFLIRTGIVWIFRNNPGSSLEFHLFDHNLLLLHPPYSLSTLVVGLALILLVFYKWNEKPSFLKSGIWILVPLFVATLFFGFLDELRDYYEVYPILLLLISHSIGNATRYQIVTVRREGSPG